MSKIQGARPGDRANHIRVRLSPKEKAYLIAYAGDRTLSLIVREALINYGALPPNTPILDKRVERKLAGLVITQRPSEGLVELEDLLA